MMLQATPKNIGWLLTQLYAAKRVLQATGVDSPCFVLLTKDTNDRFAAEQILYRYFTEKYGIETLYRKIQPDAGSQSCSIFSFPEIGCRVVLMDIELKDEK